MDETLQHVNPNPILTTNWISQGLFWWLNPLFKTGYRRPLEPEDLYNVTPVDQSDHLSNSLEREWKKELQKAKENEGKQPSLLRALFRVFGLQYMLVGLIVLLEESTKVVQPIFLGGLIQYFIPDSTVSAREAYLYAGGISICVAMMAITHHPYFFTVQRIGMRMRIACCSLMYKKCLRLSHKAMGETTTGQIVNLMSNDVNRFDQAVIFLHFLWMGPLQALTVLVLLWKELGPSVLAGFLILGLLMPLQGFMGKLFSKLRHKTAVHTDERVKVMNEIISGMRVIKMYCWEKPFGQLVESIRSMEVVKVRRTRNAQALMTVPFFTSAKVLQLATFGVLVSTTQVPLTAYRVFLAIGLLQACRLSVTLFVPFAIMHISEMSVVFRRLKTPNLTEVKKSDGPVRVERRYIRRSRYLAGYTASVWIILHRFLYYVVALALVACGCTVRLRPRALFLVMPMFFLLAHSLAGCVYEASRKGGECLTSCRRIKKFLMLEELESKDEASNLQPKPEDCLIEVKDFTGKWDQKMEQNTLDNINLKVTAGQLVAVIGPVGCGKSSLLMAVLKELPARKGTVKSAGRIGYVSQQPWIFSGSVRQNILFGAPFNKAKYDRVVKVTALKRDFEIMPQGDITLIGDRGVSLSGGQKARVSLARALYMDADIYLLDDPLSAVDTAVGRHIFEKCIVKYLGKKPRILVTHQVQYLPVADNIFILKEGRITSHGSFDELSQSGVDFSELLKTTEQEEEPSSVPVTPHLMPSDPMNDMASKLGSHVSLHSIMEDYVPEAVTLPEEEERASGTVGYRVYVDFFKAGTGILKFLFLIFLNVLAQTVYIGSDWWLSRWSNEEENKFAANTRYNAYLLEHNVSSTTNVTVPAVDSEFNIIIFSAIIASVFLFGLARALLFFRICIDASQNLHNRMFHRILRSPISFFDSNPVGRILNRFSKDIGHMDDMLPVTFFDFVQCFLLMIGIVLVAGIVNPFVFIPTLPLLILFIIIRSYYLKTSRSIKRLEGTSRSPVFSYLSATLQGLSTIRAMKMEDKCTQEFDLYQDRHTEAWFLFLATSRWLAVRLDWLSAFFVIAVTFCSLFVADTMSPGLAGLSITYSMTLMGMFQWGIRQSAEVENQMISVERVLEYSRLPEEAELESKPDRKPPPSWPSEGSIIGKDVGLQYTSTGPQVLKGLSFLIRPQEKVGIVGRTGAGKSSLISTLFRMVEPTGRLSIDKVDILNIGLHDLRKVISIIPQDPFLFSGPLRKNLDPFKEHGDESLWKSLEEVQLKDAVTEMPGGLEAEVSEGGANLSVGQRQLICLARAVLRHNRILLIDEATANVDPITDECIQATIRSKFRYCTVLTIAHRLHTIMDSDRVMVLSEGSIVEFDRPVKLLQDSGSHFHAMAQQTGKAEFEHLLEMALVADNKSKEPQIKINGAPNNRNTDNTLNDISLTLNENMTESLPYDISDIEDSLRIIADKNGLPEEPNGEELAEDDIAPADDQKDESVNEEEEKEEEREEDVSDDSSRLLSNDTVDEATSHERQALLSALPQTDSGETNQDEEDTATLEDNSTDVVDADLIQPLVSSSDGENLNKSSNSVLT